MEPTLDHLVRARGPQRRAEADRVRRARRSGWAADVALARHVAGAPQADAREAGDGVAFTGHSSIRATASSAAGCRRPTPTCGSPRCWRGCRSAASRGSGWSPPGASRGPPDAARARGLPAGAQRSVHGEEAGRRRRRRPAPAGRRADRRRARCGGARGVAPRRRAAGRRPGPGGAGAGPARIARSRRGRPLRHHVARSDGGRSAPRPGSSPARRCCSAPSAWLPARAAGASAGRSCSMRCATGRRPAARGRCWPRRPRRCHSTSASASPCGAARRTASSTFPPGRRPPPERSGNRLDGTSGRGLGSRSTRPA
jgi:translation initiation factor IF-2